MPALWTILAGISLFMLFFSVIEMSGITVGFLIAGWFGVFLLCLFEAMSLFRSNTRKPSSDEKREEYYQRMRRLSARRRS